jgi:hypothetical protein
MDMPERQQWNKGPRLKGATMPEEQEGIQQDHQKDFWAEDRKASNRVFLLAAENGK